MARVLLAGSRGVSPQLPRGARFQSTAAPPGARDAAAPERAGVCSSAGCPLSACAVRSGVPCVQRPSKGVLAVRTTAMGGCISCLVSETCAGFCTGMSLFAIVILLLLAAAVSRDYRYIGQAWKGSPESPQSRGAALKTILEVVAIYAVFLGLSMLCFMGQAARRKVSGGGAPKRRAA